MDGEAVPAPLMRRKSSGLAAAAPARRPPPAERAPAFKLLLLDHSADSADSADSDGTSAAVAADDESAAATDFRLGVSAESSNACMEGWSCSGRGRPCACPPGSSDMGVDSDEDDDGDEEDEEVEEDSGEDAEEEAIARLLLSDCSRREYSGALSEKSRART